jgi:hypothetical protein
MWYCFLMSNAADRKQTRTAMMPVTTMEEVPILSEEERAEMLASLKEAEARMEAGEYPEHDPLTFKERLLAIYKAAKASKTA